MFMIKNCVVIEDDIDNNQWDNVVVYDNIDMR